MENVAFLKDSVSRRKNWIAEETNQNVKTLAHGVCGEESLRQLMKTVSNLPLELMFSRVFPQQLN